jgi:predicted metal-dependent hydrolase
MLACAAVSLLSVVTHQATRHGRPGFHPCNSALNRNQSLTVTGAACRINPHRNIADTKRKTATVLLISKWESMIGRSVSQWGIKRMKTKWGSCNRESGHIWMNLELAKKHPNCLEYVVVHEMAHLLERNHGEAFSKLMDSLLPDWRSRRDDLNKTPLADEQWTEGSA